MAIEKTSFIFYKDWANVIKDLPAEVRLDVYDAVTEYALSGKHHDLKPMAKIAFGFIKQTLDRDTSKYMDVSTKRKEAGKIGAQKRWQNIAKRGKNSICYDNDNDNDNDKRESTNAHEAKSVGHAPASPISYSDFLKQNEKFDERKPNIPTKQQVLEFFMKSGGTMEMAKKFFENNQATGWNYRGSPIKRFEPLANGFIASWNELESKSNPKKTPINAPTYKDI